MSISLNDMYLTNFLRPSLLRHSRDTHSSNDHDCDLKVENNSENEEMDMQINLENARKRMRLHWHYYRHFLNRILSPEVIAKRIDDAISDFPYLYSPLDCPEESRSTFRTKWNGEHHWEHFKHHHRHRGLHTQAEDNEGKTKSASTGNIRNAQDSPSSSEMNDA